MIDSGFDDTRLILKTIFFIIYTAKSLNFYASKIIICKRFYSLHLQNTSISKFIYVSQFLHEIGKQMNELFYLSDVSDWNTCQTINLSVGPAKPIGNWAW